MDDLSTYLRNYFSVSDQDLEIIVKLFYKESLAKGEYFYKVNGQCDRLSFVVKGYLRVSKESQEKVTTQWISSPGYFITDLGSLVFGNLSRWDIQAVSDVSLYTITKKDYNSISKLVRSWPILEKRFLTACFMTLEDRVFNLLSLSASQRFERLMEVAPGIFNEVPLHYLASMMGMSPETLSRLRAKSIS